MTKLKTIFTMFGDPNVNPERNHVNFYLRGDCEKQFSFYHHKLAAAYPNDFDHLAMNYSNGLTWVCIHFKGDAMPTDFREKEMKTVTR